MLLAATVRVHGAKLETETGYGPEFPAEFDVKIPFLTAWKDPMAMGSSKYSDGQSDPKETEMISTPSAIASSNALSMSAEAHPFDQQTL